MDIRKSFMVYYLDGILLRNMILFNYVFFNGFYDVMFKNTVENKFF